MKYTLKIMSKHGDKKWKLFYVSTLLRFYFLRFIYILQNKDFKNHLFNICQNTNQRTED